MINEVDCGATHHYDRFVLLQTISADAAAVKARSLRDRAVKGCPLLWLPLLWYRATLDLTDSSAQQAKTTRKNEPVQSCPVPVELPVELIAFVLFGRRREELSAFAPSPTGVATVVSRTPYQLGYVPTVLRS